MARWIGAAAVAALVAGLTMFGGTPGAGAGDAFAANIYVTLEIRGTPPAGAEFVVDVPGSPFEEYQTLTFTSADLGPRLAIETLGGGEWVSVSDDGGADRVQYACTASGGSPTGPLGPTTCTADDVNQRVVYTFGGGAPAQIEVTITLTFGTCDGLPVTTFLAAGDVPTGGPDVILGSMAPETVNGLGGDDRICGLGGSDILRGGPGIDRVRGGGGADRLEGGAAGDNLMGGAANDTLLGQGGNDALDGGAQRDTCNGGAQADTGVRCEVRTGIP
jgi:hypothetical protein